MGNKYYNNKKLALNIMWIIIGIALIVMGMTGMIEAEIWSGIGGGFLGVGILQTLRNINYQNNTEYQNKIDIEANDERNRFLRAKAWSWAGYMFVIGSAVVSLCLYLMGRQETGQVLSLCMCAELILFYVSYYVLKRKY